MKAAPAAEGRAVPERIETQRAAPVPAAPVHRAAEPIAVAASPATGHAAREPEERPTADLPDRTSATIADPDAWLDWIDNSGLKGPARVLAEHAGFVGCADGVLQLALAEDDELLNKPALVDEIAQALAAVFGTPPRIRFEASARPAESLRLRNQRVRDERQVAAEDAFMNDPEVQRLITGHGARVVPDSIRPYDYP